MEWINPGTRRTRKGIMAAALESVSERHDRIRHASRSAADALLLQQTAEGYWCGKLTADSTLESDYILLQLWLHQPGSDGAWNPPSRGRIDKAVRSLLERQQPDGGWWIYPGGGAEVNATARAYTVFSMLDEGVGETQLQHGQDETPRLQ